MARSMGVNAAGILALLVCAADAFGQEGPTLEELRRKADTMKPLASELKYRQIPWGTDLLEAKRIARGENRPFLVWASGDDPLERC